MAVTKCNISFVVDYTSSTPITGAVASYKITGSANQPDTYNITPLPSSGSLVTLPDIQTPGNYDLTVKLTTAEGVVTKTSSFKIGNCSGNTPPIANAGLDQAIQLPTNTITLNGSGTDSGGSIVSYLWTNLGPQIQNVTITNPTSATTTVTGLAAGTNKFQLTVTDNNGATATDDMDVVVNVGLTKARVISVSKFPTNPTTNTVINATANFLNPSNINQLVYRWYLNNIDQGTTTTNTKSFGPLSVGTKTIKVGLVSSAGNNHQPDQQSTTFNVTQASSGGTGGGGGSFLAGTLVRMSDGSLQKVENIELGDKLKGSKGDVKVGNILIYESDAKKYRLNEKDYFVTETHPIMTDQGWKSFNPEKTKLLVPTIEVDLLQKGDILIKENGEQEVLSNTDFVTGTNLVYNFSVDNTNDYYANGYLVHNKIIEAIAPSGDGNPIP